MAITKPFLGNNFRKTKYLATTYNIVWLKLFISLFIILANRYNERKEGAYDKWIYYFNRSNQALL